jgi:DNA anti-recombination protein RmuC
MSETNADPNLVTINRRDAELWQKSTALLDKMLGDPTTAPAAEDLIKKLNPQAVFPGRASREALLAPMLGEVEKVRTENKAEIEAANARATALQERLDARDAREAEAAQKAQEASLTAQLQSIQSRRGFSEETMQKVLDRMREQNNPDVDAAAAWVAESIPKPLPATGHDYLPSTVDVYGSASDPTGTMWETLHQNPSKWQTDQLRAIVKDPEFLRLGNQ